MAAIRGSPAWSAHGTTVERHKVIRSVPVRNSICQFGSFSPFSPKPRHPTCATVSGRGSALRPRSRGLVVGLWRLDVRITAPEPAIAADPSGAFCSAVAAAQRFS